MSGGDRPPARPARRNGAKSDELDAVRAAREALSREHPAALRARGDWEAWNSASYQTVQSTEKRVQA